MWGDAARSTLVGSGFVRFAAVGVANTAVHCAAYLASWVVLPYVVAHVVATVTAMLCSYVLNCRFTFGVVPRARTLLLYPLSNVPTIALSAGVVAVLVGVFGVGPVVAPVLGGLLVLPVTFLLSKRALTCAPTPAAAASLTWRARFHARKPEIRAAVAVAALVAVLAQIPALVNPSFYFWDDSAAQFLPMWHRLGERLLAGEWPLLLDADAWMGGNLAAEALFGVWNPLHLLDYLLVVAIGDLAVAATAIKTQFLVVLGVGVHALCRGYGASRAAASVLATALPVSGFVLYFQASSWAAGLMGFAWVPWVWWSLRRMADGRAAPWVVWVFCFLCVSAGDPYGVLAMCAIFGAVLVETALAGKPVARLAGVGAAAALTLPLVFLPLVMTGPVTWRSGLELFNVGQLVPDIADLLNASMPGFAPQILSFGSFRMTVPATYLAWFVVPLLPWLNWRAALAHRRRCCAALVLAGFYALLCLGPSNAWLFRWPLRHVAVLWLAVSVLFAVALSHGLRTDRLRVRLTCTAAALAGSAYLSFAAWPSQSLKHLASLVVICGLLVVVLASRTSASRAVVIHLGTACALVMQMWWFPANRDVATYNFPTDVDRVRAEFADVRGGTLFQIADRNAISGEDVESGRAWRRLLFGHMHAVAEVPSLVSYTGIGYEPLHRRLCLSYYGSACAEAYRRLWKADETGAVLADQLRLDRVVVQRKLIDDPEPPPGWQVSERAPDVVVLRRQGSLPWREGRLSVAHGVTVSGSVQDGQRAETVRFRAARSSGAELVFARLAWPGYSATVDGVPTAVRSTSAGLLKVVLPRGAEAGTLRVTWQPPWFGLQAVLAALGAALAVVLSTRTRRAEPC